MRHALRLLLALAALGVTFSPAPAHYNIFLPEKHSVRRGETVTLLYQWGHPFEHQLFNAPAPEKVFVVAPDGTITDVTKQLENVIAVTASGDRVTAYRLRFTAAQRGDYVFILNTVPIWMPEDQLFFQDSVKVVLHVQAQRGWDAAAEVPFQLTPLTRPYGLLPNMVFQAQVQSQRLSNQTKEPAPFLVEIEHYNPSPPATLPPDEQITRTVKTDPNNVMSCTLTDPGWWCITAQRNGGQRQHEGKSYPVRERATFWVYVDERVIANLGK
jgi:cobalt/nickel transport protein